MSHQNLKFKICPYEHPTYVVEVNANSKQTMKDPQVGDKAILYSEDDINNENPIGVKIKTINGNNIEGNIEGSNKYAARGCECLSRGKSINFLRQNIFGLDFPLEN